MKKLDFNHTDLLAELRRAIAVTKAD